MRILTDRHHADLLYANQRLFEDRLGIELYVMLGLDWWSAGFWRFGEVFGDNRLAQQYLNIDAKYKEVEQGVFITFDQCHPERPLYGVTLQKAETMKWDFVLATVQENQYGFKRFAVEANAKYLYYVGNTRQGIDWSLDPWILDSTSSAKDPEARIVQISQEFDHERIFRYREPAFPDWCGITSFVNLLPQIPQSWEPFEQLNLLMPQRFRSFGHHCPGGFLTPVAAVAEEMAIAKWAYHDKPTGDGFGHVIHAWAAVGRPLIGHGRFYEGQRAEVFWQDGLTCIDLDKHSIEEVAEIIKSTDKKQHREMCVNIRNIFDEVYDPVQDAKRVAEFLEVNQ